MSVVIAKRADAMREAACSLEALHDPLRAATLLDVDLPRDLLTDEPLLDEEGG